MTSTVIELGNKFVGKTGTLDGSHLASKKLLVIYYGALHSQSSKEFTPLLVEWYNQVQTAMPDVLEVIYASFDWDAPMFEEHFESMPWIAFPLDDEIVDLGFCAAGHTDYPSISVLDSKGNLICSNGKSEIESLNVGVVAHWLSKL